MNAQTNQNKSAIKLSVQKQKMQQLALDHWRANKEKNDIVELGRRAFLPGDDYKKVLNLWIQKTRAEKISSSRL